MAYYCWWSFCIFLCFFIFNMAAFVYEAEGRATEKKVEKLFKLFYSSQWFWNCIYCPTVNVNLLLFMGGKLDCRIPPTFTTIHHNSPHHLYKPKWDAGCAKSLYMQSYVKLSWAVKKTAKKNCPIQSFFPLIVSGSGKFFFDVVCVCVCSFFNLKKYFMMYLKPIFLFHIKNKVWFGPFLSMFSFSHLFFIIVYPYLFGT